MGARHSLLAALLGLALAAPAWAQGRVIDAWSGIVLNCGPASAARWANDACKRLIGEMQKQADAAKITFVALPDFADDVTLDRRAAELGLPPLMNHLHVRFEIAPPAPGARDQSATIRLVLRSFTTGPLFSTRKDGDYPVLSYSPQIILQNGNDHAQAISAMQTLAELFFSPMLKPRS
jgi:hypothetical protein